MNTLPRKLAERPELRGFSVVHLPTSRRMKPDPDWSHAGIICDDGAGFFMGENGQLYAKDAYERIFPIYPSEKVRVVENRPW